MFKVGDYWADDYKFVRDKAYPKYSYKNFTALNGELKGYDGIPYIGVHRVTLGFFAWCKVAKRTYKEKKKAEKEYLKKSILEQRIAIAQDFGKTEEEIEKEKAEKVKNAYEEKRKKVRNAYEETLIRISEEYNRLQGSK